jgi:CHAD domain-containing protein
MRLSVAKAVKPVRRLRKLFKEVPPNLPPEYVHNVRTQARKLEASAHAVSSERDRRVRRLLKCIKPIRKTAGDVRDMDVMIAKLLAVANQIQGDGDALLRLTEEMAALREKNATELRRLLKRDGKPLRDKLKRYAAHVKKAGNGEMAESVAAPEMLAAQLQHWPPLKPDNLHEFRIHAKELRYMLQLTPETDEHTLQSFARVKDVAGEWHDWLQLREFAAKELDQKQEHELLTRLRAIEHQKLRAALAAANAARHDGLAAI